MLLGILQAMGDHTFWFTCFLATVILLLPVVAWRFYSVDVHPTLTDNEAEIDIAINKFKSKTVQTIKQWVTTGLQRLGKYNFFSF